ncbi:MAG: 5-(carboxyamino)imidazole ribonucleotide synthase [Bacteroidota bacterium]|nr:5-(carboxyamino)imidazole ribonucleotide synthase [Bacteroidota bacterium]
MKQHKYPLMKIGIIGGGQLGKMMAQKAKKMGFHISVLDPSAKCPATAIADELIVGSFYDKEKITQLVEQSDVTTFDIEHIDTETLKTLSDAGHNIFPSPYLLEIIQDKLRQKEVLSENGIPIPKFQNVESSESLSRMKFPFVQKARKGGYDGRGVVVMKNKSDLQNAIQTESMVEELINFDKELAIMVARSTSGEIKTYPVVEMIFDKRANICDLIFAPARIENHIAKKATQIAVKSVEALDGVGIFGVEMFLAGENIYVNEIAPRPHNSGHYTIEASATCQFEQHIRAITGLPLGSTDLLSPAVMLNLLGEENYKGKPIIEGLNEALSIPGLSFHFYGKETTSPFRKMGHVTILNNNLEVAIQQAEKIKSILKIKTE